MGLLDVLNGMQNGPRGQRIKSWVSLGANKTIAPNALADALGHVRRSAFS
jgi:uncharacterized protein YidB (DUF937 family)